MDPLQEPAWMSEPCPGDLPWDSCHADDCGVSNDGTGCRLSTPSERSSSDELVDD